MKIVNLSYSQFKSIVDSKALLAQYVDSPGRYDLFAIEAQVSWEASILKDGGADVTDFETNYKANYNKPLEYRSVDGLLKTAPSKFVENLSLYVDGENGSATVTGNTTTYLKTHYDVPYTLAGVDIAWSGATIGDYVDFEVGFYTNEASEGTFQSLNKFANQYHMISTDGSRLFDVPTVKVIPSSVTIGGNTYNIWIRSKIVNSGLTSLSICINLIGWK